MKGAVNDINQDVTFSIKKFKFHLKLLTHNLNDLTVSKENWAFYFKILTYFSKFRLFIEIIRLFFF